MRFRFRIESSGLSNQGSSMMNPLADAKTTSRRFSLMSGASLPLALALGTTLCGGALLAGPTYAAPLVGSDENGPQVQILSPAYQDVIKGSFRIAVSITAKNYNPEFIEMLVDDQSATGGPVPLSAFGNAANTSFDWDTRKFSDGPHRLTVRVTDKQGFRGWAEVNIFINNKRAVDTLPPSLVWQNLENFTSISGRAQIQLDAKDNFGVKMLMVTINPVNAPDKKPAAGTWLFNRPPYIVNFDSTRVEDGLYTVKANAWDSMDQQGEATQMTIGVINNPVNARTVGEMLEGMQTFENVVANPKPAPRAVAPLPAEVKPRTQTVRGWGKVDPDVKAVPKIAKNTQQAAPVPAQNSALTPKRYQGALASQTNNVEAVKSPALVAKLIPSQPMFGVRTLPEVKRVTPEVTAPVSTVNTKVEPKENVRLAERGEVVEPLAAPQLSSIGAKSEPLATREISPLDSGVEHKSGLRIAKLDTSGLSMREETALPNSPVEVDAPSLSKVVDLERLARVAAIETQISTGQSVPQGRLSAPSLQARFVKKVEAVTSVAKTLTTPTKNVEVAALPAVEAAPSVATKPALTNRWKAPDLAVAQSSKAVSTPQKVEIARVGVAAQPTIAVPVSVAAVPESKPQLSAPKTVAPTVSAGKTTFSNVRGGVSKVIRKALVNGPKVEVPEKAVLAALPKAEKSAIASRQAAITVAPIEVSARTMPAVHHVERTTTLRAVAARYGLPVELVAACNVWPVEMNVVKGMKVKLPRPLQVSYNGSPVTSDAQSMLVGDSAVTAFRFMFEKAGGTMKWDAKTQRVIAKKGETEIILTIGSKTAQIGDQKVMMELAAFLFEGRTMVPVRLFEEGLRAEIEWDPQTGRMVVAMINPTASSTVMNG
jgi:hypothetical protein